MNRILLVALACLLPYPAWADDWQYTLRPGDDLWTIARDYCGSAGRASDIADHNGLTNVATIRAGQRLAIPTAWLTFAPATATVVEVSGDVRIRRGSAPTDQSEAAAAGDILSMGHSLITGEGAALVEFADASELAVQPNSSVLFNKLTAFGPAGMVDTHLRFAYGRGNVRVQPQNRGDRFRVQTPQGIAAVRGTEFRVGHRAEDSASNTETLEGRVAFLRAARSTDLPAGFGAAASAAGVVKEALLPAPQWLDQGLTTAEQSTLGWQGVAGAVRYVVNWAEQTRPDIVVAQAAATGTSISVGVLPGSYRLSVRGVSASDIEGYDAYRNLQVKALAPSLNPIATELAGIVDFSWQYAQATAPFTLTLDADHLDTPETIDTRETRYSAPLPAGRYRWQVQAEGSAASAPQTFTLTPPAPENLRIKRRDKTLHISWAPSDVADTYRLRLRGATNIEEVVTGNSTELTVPTYGEYQLELVSEQNSLQSEALTSPVKVYRRPWWMSLLIPLVVL